MKLTKVAGDSLRYGRKLANIILKPFKQQHTIFHITHHKAGSQWLYRILLDLDQNRIVKPTSDGSQFLNNHIVNGKIYPTVYVSKDQFLSVSVPSNSKYFVVIRDLRDTLVSAYFSLKHSHAVGKFPENHVCRCQLNNLSQEDGFVYLINQWLPLQANIQLSWAGHREIIRYEDLLTNDLSILSKILFDEFRLGNNRDHVLQVIESKRFSSETNGRRRGDENIFSHQRKGTSGDWRNHFTPRIVDMFKEQFGNVLIKTGYESDNNWQI